jgi:hypothetical protein
MVASTIAKGTSSILAMVLATNVLACSGLSHHNECFQSLLIVLLLLHQTFVVIVNRN